MKCIFSIMNCPLGNKIANEMIVWLKPLFDITEVYHNGKEWEWPGINAACALSLSINEPVLYIHTKGAGHDNTAQKPIRDFWKKELTTKLSLYEKALETHDVVCPITGKEKQTWFNMFMANPKAWDTIKNSLIKPNLENRYFYENMWYNTNTDVYGIVSNDIDSTNVSNIWKFVK